MKKLIYLLLISVSALAQNKTISGLVKDTQNEWVLGATVKLFTKDSILVKGSITDEKGRFKIEKLNNGQYFLSVSAITYQDFRGIGFELNEKSNAIDFPTIYLLPAKSVELKEVTVSARKPLIENEIDRTIVNVEAMISAASSNSLEVLERTPGVVVDAQSNINLNGKSGVLVLIDGRSTYMSGTDLAAYLKSLPGSMLEKLELMDNPPAKYEAAGGAVINIVLKKNRNLGLTGNTAVGYSQGQTGRSNNSLNLNYYAGKVNWFGNLAYNLDGNHIEEKLNREIFAENGNLQTALVGNNSSKYSSNGLLSRIGADINVSEKTVLGMQIFYQARPRKESADYENKVSNSQTAISQQFTGTNSGTTDWNTKGANFNFTQKLKANGQEISADLNYINYAYGGIKDFTNNFENIATQRFDNETIGNINIYNFKTDYSHPFAKGAKLDAGIKTSYVKNDNDAVFNKLISNNSEIDYSRSNHFIYNENINAAYINFQKPINKKLSVQLGLRAENTNLLGELLPNQSIKGERFTQNFTNLFPTAFLAYKWGKDNRNTLNSNYSKRINRPNYQQFNPFLNFVDAYTFSQGNTEVRPFYLNNFRIMYNYNQKYTTSFGYTAADGILGDITIRRGDTFIRKPYNVGTGYQLFLSQIFALKPTTFWNANLNFTAAKFSINGAADGHSATANFYSGRISINNHLTLKKGWAIDFSAFFKAADRFYPVETLGSQEFYFAIQKKLLKNMASIRLNFDDIVHGNINQERSTNFQLSNQYRKIVYDTQRVGLAFTYRFGNEKFARKRRHQDNAAQEEQGRVN
jgi:hypothetical protein